MLGFIAIALSIIALILKGIAKYWYLVLAYILFISIPAIIKHIKNSSQAPPPGINTHNDVNEQQTAESKITEVPLQYQVLEKTSQEATLSDFGGTEPKAQINTGSTCEKLSADAMATGQRSNTQPTNATSNSNVLEKNHVVEAPVQSANTAENLTSLETFSVYCAMQKEYGIGHIVSINPKFKIMTIQFPKGDVNFDISYIGKSILAVSGQEETNKLKEIIDSMLDGNSITAQNLNGANCRHEPSSQYHSDWETSPVYHVGKVPARFYYVGEVPCFSEEWISRRVSVERTKARGKLLYETNGVLRLQHSGQSYQATVRGSSGFSYICNFSVDADGKIATWHCGCPAFAKYPKACKHLVAAFYAAREET